MYLYSYIYCIYILINLFISLPSDMSIEPCVRYCTSLKMTSKKNGVYEIWPMTSLVFFFFYFTVVFVCFYRGSFRMTEINLLDLTSLNRAIFWKSISDIRSICHVFNTFKTGVKVGMVVYNSLLRSEVENGSTLLCLGNGTDRSHHSFFLVRLNPKRIRVSVIVP